jgi:hypothetical protein
MRNFPKYQEDDFVYLETDSDAAFKNAALAIMKRY